LDQIGYFQAVLGFTLGLPLNVFLIEEIDYFKNDTDSYAVYGDGTYALSENLEFTLGLRYSRDEKTYCNKTPQSPSVGAFMELLTGVAEGGLAYTPNGDTWRCGTESWSAWQPRAVVNYYFGQEILTYASISRGYKAGGFTKMGDGLADFDPEYIWNYELGLKSTLWEGRMRLNSALFYYEYTDLQVNGLVPDASGINKAVIQNAGEASGTGIEVDMLVSASDRIMINAAFAYTEAEYDKFIEVIDTGTGATNDRKGNWLAPRLQAVLGVDIALPLLGTHELTFRAEAFHTGRFYYDNEQLDRRPSRTLANARLTYAHPNGALRVIAFVENLTDKEYYDSKEGLFDPPFTTTHRRKPRTYGLTASYAF
jgi:iron complex outermembrane receptor protein